LSLWLSIFGVFYIFLFIQYFSNLNKIISFILFNVWIFLSINPIVHYFFGIVSLSQLYSPLFTIGFVVFYPIELFLHLINMGGLLDNFIEMWLSIKPFSKEVFTPIWFFGSYILLSLFSIVSKKIFILFNIIMICFNLWLYGG
jgi:competence protein ComEC